MDEQHPAWRRYWRRIAAESQDRMHRRFLAAEDRKRPIRALADTLLAEPSFRHDVTRQRLDLEWIAPNGKVVLSSDGEPEPGRSPAAASAYLQAKYQLGDNWKIWLGNCIMFGLDHPWVTRNVPETVTFHKADRDGEQEPRITIRVYAETTLQDIELIWREIALEQELLPSYRPHRKRGRNENAGRNDYIVQLNAQGLGASTIARRCEERGWEDVTEFVVYSVLRRNRS